MKISLQSHIPESAHGQRLDQVLALLFPQYSRSRLQQWVKLGFVLLDGQKVRNRDKVMGGELVQVEVQQEDEQPAEAEALPLDIVFEDEHILVINKPCGLVVHPGAGVSQGTLLNALLHYSPELQHLPRAGIVHRLDRDTTGLMVVAKTLEAQNNLVQQLQARTVSRHYQCVVHGYLVAGGTIDEPLARHPRDRKRYCVKEGGKQAITHYRIQQRFRHHSHLDVFLETGRTHQIRVHMSHIGHALVGDKVYGGRQKLPKQCHEDLKCILRAFPRQALHAMELTLQHPVNQQTLTWHQDLPEDMQSLLIALREFDGI